MFFLTDPLFVSNAQFLALLGLFIMIAEFKLPTKGALWIIGALLFFSSTFSLTSSPSPFWHLSWPMFYTLNILVLGSLFIIALITIRNYNISDPKTTAPYIGQIGRVLEWTEDNKRIDVGDVIWQAKSQSTFKPGDKVTVTAQDNLILTVIPFGESL